jgi:hypothetical protein
MRRESTVVLKPIGRQAAEAVAAGRVPDVAVAPGYPTEFSAGIGQNAGPAPAGGLRVDALDLAVLLVAA